MPDFPFEEQTISLPDDISGKDCLGGYVCSFHKAGSTMLFHAVRRLALRAGIKHADLLKLCFDQRILLDDIRLSAEGQKSLENWLRRPGILYSGWRQYPTNYNLPITSQTRTHLLVRDPRDIATSKYFSLKYSHSAQGIAGRHVIPARAKLQEMDIDDYCIEHARIMLIRFKSYTPLENSQLMVRRYEDIIFEKRKFLSDICAHFEFEVRPAAIDRIADSIDTRPEKEDIQAHVRQVTPGDHRRKLKPETIEQMNEILADVLAAYNYPAEVETANV